MRTSSIAFVLVLFSSGQSPAAAPKPSAPARHLPEPEHIRPETRQQMRARMGQHAITMENLVRAVVLLDRPTVRTLATRIADEEVVDRTSGMREKQPPVLPGRFFEEQDVLAASARQLAAAAIDGGQDAALAERFAILTQTCVACHSTYLHDHPVPSPMPGEQKPAAK